MRGIKVFFGGAVIIILLLCIVGVVLCPLYYTIKLEQPLYLFLFFVTPFIGGIITMIVTPFVEWIIDNL